MMTSRKVHLPMIGQRLIFMAQPPLGVCSAMSAILHQYALDALMGSTMFPALNWHQSLSGRQAYSPLRREQMLRAGGRISAPSVLMTLSSIREWAFRTKGRPRGFDELLSAIRAAELEEGILDNVRNSPHVTLSYKAPPPIPPINIAPVDWLIDELLLVVGGGSPYHYEIIGRWPLLPLPPESSQQQLALFST